MWQPMWHIRRIVKRNVWLLENAAIHLKASPINFSKNSDVDTFTLTYPSFHSLICDETHSVINAWSLSHSIRAPNVSHAGQMEEVNVIGATYKRNKCHATQTIATHVSGSRARFSCRNYYLFISLVDWLRKRFVISILMRFLLKGIYLI